MSRTKVAAARRRPGYTSGMKTAVSVPDDVFESAERLARRARRSRSEVYSAALREYVARHSPDEITDALNEVIEETRASIDPFVAAAAARTIDRVEW
jgi:predicted transcriptional regulator